MKRLLVAAVFVMTNVSVFAFQAIQFDTKVMAEQWISAFETRWDHADGWKYAFPEELKSGKYIVRITPSAFPKLTQEEANAIADIQENDVVKTDPLP